MHAVYAAPSSEHSKVAPDGAEAKLNVAEPDVAVPDGPPVMVVSGAVGRPAPVSSILPWA